MIRVRFYFLLFFRLAMLILCTNSFADPYIEELDVFTIVAGKKVCDKVIPGFKEQTDGAYRAWERVSAKAIQNAKAAKYNGLTYEESIALVVDRSLKEILQSEHEENCKNIAEGIQYRTNIVTSKEIFDRDEKVDSNGTSLVDEIDIPPLFLVRRFGKPADGDGLGVSGSYTFKGNDENVFTVYDYNMTTQTSTDKGLPTPGELWSQSYPAELHIGSNVENASKFKKWLLNEYEIWKKNKN